MYFQKIKSLFSSILPFVGMVFVALVIFSSIAGFAQVQECNIPKTSVKWTSLVNPGAFLPIIPESCGAKEGQVQPLSLGSLPDIFLRLYGFLVSLAFTMILPVFVVAGIWYIWGGFNGGDVKGPLNYLEKAAMGLGLILVFYLMIFTILNLFGFTATSTNIKNFFN